MSKNPVPIQYRVAWSAEEAAMMCSVSKSTFLKWVREGKMPQPEKGNRFSSAGIRNAFNTSKTEKPTDPYDEWRMMNG